MVPHELNGRRGQGAPVPWFFLPRRAIVIQSETVRFHLIQLDLLDLTIKNWWNLGNSPANFCNVSSPPLVVFSWGVSSKLCICICCWLVGNGETWGMTLSNLHRSVRWFTSSQRWFVYFYVSLPEGSYMTWYVSLLRQNEETYELTYHTKSIQGIEVCHQADLYWIQGYRYAPQHPSSTHCHSVVGTQDPRDTTKKDEPGSCQFYPLKTLCGRVGTGTSRSQFIFKFPRAPNG